MTIKIYIPSSNRPHVHKTVFNLSEALWPTITVVVPPKQYSEYRANLPAEVDVLAFYGDGITAKRQSILTLDGSGKILMLDDDLSFYLREPDGNKFLVTSPSATEQMVFDIDAYLTNFAYVGVVDKFMSQHRPRNYQTCVRFNQVMGINRDLLPQPWPQFRPEIHEEHDFNLQLLTRGCATAISTEWSKTDIYDAPGGCSEWRSTELMINESNKMLQWWPGIVSIAKKLPHGAHLRYNWRRAAIQGGLLLS